MKRFVIVSSSLEINGRSPNLSNCGKDYTKHLNYQTRMATYLVAMGNSKGMVKRLSMDPINARKYLTMMRYDFTDYRNHNMGEIPM